MAHKIIWSPAALSDLEAIAEYIARDSEVYAARVVQRVVDAIERAAQFPDLALTVPEFDHDKAIREVFVHNYRILYRIANEAIHIGAIIHGARRLQQAIEGRKI